MIEGVKDEHSQKAIRRSKHNSSEQYYPDFGLNFMAKRFPNSSFDCDVEIPPDFNIFPHESGAMIVMTVMVDQPYMATILVPESDTDSLRHAYESSSRQTVSLCVRLQEQIYTTPNGERLQPVVAEEWNFQ